MYAFVLKINAQKTQSEIRNVALNVLLTNEPMCTCVGVPVCVCVSVCSRAEERVTLAARERNVRESIWRRAYGL